MRKSISLFIMFATLSVAVNAQRIGCGLKCFAESGKDAKTTSMKFAERFSICTIQGVEYISLLAEVHQGVTESDLMKIGCKTTSRSGNIVSLKARVDCIDKIISSSLFKRIDTAKKVGGVHLDKANQDVNADWVREGYGDLPEGYDGTGVIVGVADWGFDYTHPVFYDTAMNNYRIIAAWDQYRSSLAPPEGFDYGSCIYGQENLLAIECDTNNIYDLGLHGTHVASIAAGGGAGTKYRGIAPGAELLVSSWLLDEGNVLDAYSWMRDEAKRQGKRLVINNSWGLYNFGEMDGTSLFDDFVYNMSEQDSVIFVTSAGNNRGSSFHIKCEFAESEVLRSEVQFNLPIPASDDYWGQTLNLVGETTDIFGSQIELHFGQEVFSTDMMMTTSDTPVTSGFFLYNDNTDSLIYRLTIVPASDGHKAQMEWEIRLSNLNTTAKVELAVTAPSGIVHAWNVAYLTTGGGNWGMPFVWKGVGYVAGDSEYSIGEPAIGRGTIAIAAHNGVKRNSTSNANIANFSSGGPNLCSYLKPEVSAPGVLITAALSSFTTAEATVKHTVEFNGKTYGFAAFSGTSMSSPVVSGIVALMLQANGNLTPQQVKDILTSTARSDMFTGEVPNFDWGYGKVDAYEAVKRAVALVGLPSVNLVSDVKLFPNPAKDHIRIDNLPQDCKLLTISDICGREVMNCNAATNMINVEKLTKGLYLLTLQCKDKTLTFKFVKE